MSSRQLYEFVVVTMFVNSKLFIHQGYYVIIHLDENSRHLLKLAMKHLREEMCTVKEKQRERGKREEWYFLQSTTELEREEDNSKVRDCKNKTTKRVNGKYVHLLLCMFDYLSKS